MKISENEVRDCFLKCGNKNPNGLYHGEGDDALDLLEFAQYVADYVSKVHTDSIANAYASCKC